MNIDPFADRELELIAVIREQHDALVAARPYLVEAVLESDAFSPGDQRAAAGALELSDGAAATRKLVTGARRRHVLDMVDGAIAEGQGQF